MPYKNDAQRKAVHANKGKHQSVVHSDDVRTTYSKYGGLHERVMKDPEFKKRVDKMLRKRTREQKKAFNFRKKHEFDAGKCSKFGKHKYKRCYGGSSCECGSFIGDP